MNVKLTAGHLTLRFLFSEHAGAVFVLRYVTMESKRHTKQGFLFQSGDESAEFPVRQKRSE